ncbi:MAG: hypothetical protein FVQ06_04805 [candidate division NC10 bacterium]|nr:hypothetical protein [candidate division NC10 bacterium]
MAWLLIRCTGLLRTHVPDRTHLFATRTLPLFIGTKQQPGGRPIAVDFSAVGVLVRVNGRGETEA